jgi:hypothetical protein
MIQVLYLNITGVKAPESLCYLLMYINQTLNKDYLLTFLLLLQYLWFLSNVIY